MKTEEAGTQSMVGKFTREYLLVSLVPTLLLIICASFVAAYAQRNVALLIRQSTDDLNTDAEHHLETYGKRFIHDEARNAAEKIGIFLRFNPGVDIDALRQHDFFLNLTMRKVGETGYTCMYESGTGIMRIHPNPDLVDRDMRFLSEKLPSWWAIFETSLSGKEISGYYDWIEPDGRIRKKYMTMTPVPEKLMGKTMMVAATTYIDEFSTPIFAMRKKSNEIVTRYQRLIDRGRLIMGSVMAGILVFTFFGVYMIGRHSALKYMLPIVSLAGAVKTVGEKRWDIGEDALLSKRTDEIGQLASAFYKMRSQLEKTFHDLEKRLVELKSTQKALKKSEAHYRGLFDSIPVGLYRTSADGRILDSNPMLIKMLGYSDRNDFFSLNAEKLYMDPNDRTQWKTALENHESEYRCEVRMRCKDGSLLWVENHSVVVRDSDGNVLYYEGSLKGITERKEAEAALRRSQENYKRLFEEAESAKELYRSLLHSSADAIVIYDNHGCPIYISPVFTNIFEWTLEELKDKQIPYVPESEHEKTAAMITNLVERGITCQGFETKRFTKDGTLLDVSISASTYEDHEGRPAGVLAILRDISEKKKMEEQMRFVQRMEAIGTLAGGIAHDFNNLMMGILGNTSLIMQQLNPDNPLCKYLGNIEKLVESGAGLTAKLLGYARKGNYKKSAVDLNHVVGECAETFGRTKKEIAIHTKLSSETLITNVDRSELDQVLLNLFVNASDAMLRGGDLYLKTGISVPDDSRTHEKYAMLEIRDTGIGMDPETQKRIFEPFFTTKEMGRGTGLGLASVYGFVEAHRGHISVVSEPGRGTIFRIWLPLSDKTADKAGKDRVRVTKGVGTILLVDDEEMVRDVGVRMMREMGYDMLQAGSFSEAVSVFLKNQNRIDLVVLDLIMPGTGGEETYDELRKIDPKIKVLLSSGYSLDGQAREVMKRGCDGFIQKPYDMQTLSMKINEVLTIKG